MAGVRGGQRGCSRRCRRGHGPSGRSHGSPPGPARGRHRQRGFPMFARAVLGLVTAAVLLLAAPAFAQPPVTETTTQQGLVETFVDVVPTCQGGGPLYT